MADDPGVGGNPGGGLGDAVGETGDVVDIRPPKRDGHRDGQRVRKDDYLWQWDSSKREWTRVRPTRPEDKKKYEHARDALDASEADTGSGAGGAGGGSSGGGGGTGGGGGGADKGGAIPNGYERWKVGDEWFVVYRSPKSLPGKPILMAWKVRNKDELNRITGSNPKADKEMSREEFRERNVLRFGSTFELASGLTKHPWEQFKVFMRDSLETQPWLANPEMLALHAASWLETASSPTVTQIQSTDWWQRRTPEERQALTYIYANGGPGSATFRRDRKQLQDMVEETLTTAGFDFAGNRKRVVNFFTNKLLWGKMGQEEFQDRAEEIANPYATGASASAGVDELPKGAKVVKHRGNLYVRINGKDHRLDNGFLIAKYGAGAVKVDEINRSSKFSRYLNRHPGLGAADGDRNEFDSVEGEENVRELIDAWLGPKYGSAFTDREILQWAQRISENPAAQEEFINKLRAKRKVMLPDYDESLTWRDIASTWTPVYTSIWGTTPEPDDARLEKVMRLNDRDAAEKYLRNEGLRTGNQYVANQALQDLTASTGGSARPGGLF